ncbi:MAG: hypothetical protein ACYCYF_13400, partial [Anaerolineae bacterium]
MAAGEQGHRMGTLARALLTVGMVVIGLLLMALISGPVAAPEDAPPLAADVNATVTADPLPASLTADEQPPAAPVAASASAGADASTGDSALTTPAPITENGLPTAQYSAGTVVSAPAVSIAGGALAPETVAPAPTATVASMANEAAAPTATAGSVPVATAMPTTAPATETPAPPTAEATPTSAELVPVPEATPTSAEEARVPLTFEDLADLESYLLLHRGSIGGQQLEILSLTVDTTDPAVPYFVLAVEGSESTDVFAVQTAADILDYGRLLLGD